MKPPTLLAALVAFVPAAMFATPDNMAAQQAEHSITTAPVAKRAPASPRRTASFGQITAADIADSKAHTAYDVVSRLRATWLRPRGVTSLSFGTGVIVYLDGMRVGGIQELRQLNANSVGSIQYLDGVEATLRFGTGNGGGAIVVSTRH